MFALRGLAVCFSVFALVYVSVSLAVCGLRNRIALSCQRFSARRCANTLFAWRMLPLAAAAATTAVFALPSFLFLEPRSIDEPVGAVPLALALCGLLLLLFGTANAARALLKSSKTIAAWQDGASVERSGPVRLLRGTDAFPTLVAARNFPPQNPDVAPGGICSDSTGTANRSAARTGSRPAF